MVVVVRRTFQTQETLHISRSRVGRSSVLHVYKATQPAENMLEHLPLERNLFAEKAVWQIFRFILLALGVLSGSLTLKDLYSTAGDEASPTGIPSPINPNTGLFVEAERLIVADICDMHNSISEMTREPPGLVNLFDFVDMEVGYFNRHHGAAHICKACQFPTGASIDTRYLLYNRVVSFLSHSETRDTYMRVFSFGGPNRSESQVERQDRYAMICSSALSSRP
ncbi:hypothetical protein F4861DRAFT_536440 [Xylaria intraflava]|nr:hypothetical protein F4861DRAFT_536440 [Xylaria intraflava]